MRREIFNWFPFISVKFVCWLTVNNNIVHGVLQLIYTDIKGSQQGKQKYNKCKSQVQRKNSDSDLTHMTVIHTFFFKNELKQW